MWIFARKGFLSIVQHQDEPEMLVVRSRFAGHIEQLFSQAKVMRTPWADYLYRAFIPRSVVAERLQQMVNEIDYGNFKDSIEDEMYHVACMEVWSALYRRQKMRKD